MRLLFAFAVMAMATLSTPAHAIDCPRATSHIDHMICSDPKLLRADAAMNQAYAAILKAAPDAEIRAMLVTSQKRWIKARDSSFGDLDNGTNGMTGDGYSKVLQHSLVLHATVDRTSDLGMSDKNPKRWSLIHTALEQRRFAAQFTGGPFAGFETNCSFLPRQAGDPGYDYGCFGTSQYQNKDRICGETQDWASWRVYTSRGAAEIVGGKPKLVATCKDDSCFDDADTGKNAVWDVPPDPKNYGIISPSPKLDAEADDGDEKTWLKACLTDKRFPLAQSRK